MLKPLAPEVQQCLRSGVAITSYAQATEELVHNAVDAGASCIAVRVDLDRKKLQVVDNGCGVHRDGLDGIGERYHTSKCTTVEDLETHLQHYGYRGEALASIRHMAYLLDIETRAKGSTSTYTKLFKEGVAQGLKPSKTQRPSNGTTVTVYDLFSTMPVRNKSMKKALELEKIKKNMEAVSLIHPKVSFSMKDEESGNKVLQTHKSNSVVGAFTHLFGTAKARSLVQVASENGDIKVTGYVGKEGHSNKHLQYIYINGRLVLKTKIHKLINHCMSKSTVLRRKGFDASTKWSPGNTTEDVGANRHTDRHAVYVIDVKCPLSAYDITFDPRKTLVEFKDWDIVIKCVETAVKDFLVREGLYNTVENIENSPGIQAIFLGSSISLDSQDSQENEDCSGNSTIELTAECVEASSFKPMPGNVSKPSIYGSSISTSDISNVLQSEVVKINVNSGQVGGDINHDNSTNGVTQTYYNNGGISPSTGLKCGANNTDKSPTGKQGSIETTKSVKSLECSININSDAVDAGDGIIIDSDESRSLEEGPPSLVASAAIPYSEPCESPPNLIPASPSNISQGGTPNSKCPLEAIEHVPIKKTADSKVSIIDISCDTNNGHASEEMLRVSSLLLSGESCTDQLKNDKEEESVHRKENSQVSTDLYNTKISVEGNKSKMVNLFSHVKKLQNMKTSFKQSRTVRVQSPDQKCRTIFLSRMQGISDRRPSSQQIRYSKILSPMLKLRRKYELLNCNRKSQSPVVKKLKKRKPSGVFLNDDQTPSTSHEKVAAKQNSYGDTLCCSPVSSENITMAMEEDPLSVLSSPASVRKNVKVTVVEGGETIQTQSKSDQSCLSSNSGVSSGKTLSSPLRRIRERLLAKVQARRALAEQETSADLSRFSSCKKHADKSKHKNSPWKEKPHSNKNNSHSSSQNIQTKILGSSEVGNCMGESMEDSNGISELPESPLTCQVKGKSLVPRLAENIYNRKRMHSPNEDSVIPDKVSKEYFLNQESMAHGRLVPDSAQFTMDNGCFQHTFVQKLRSEIGNNVPRLISRSDLSNALTSLDSGNDCALPFSHGIDVSKLYVPPHLTNGGNNHAVHSKSIMDIKKHKLLPKLRRFMTSDDFLQSADKFNFRKAMETLEKPTSDKSQRPDCLKYQKNLSHLENDTKKVQEVPDLESDSADALVREVYVVDKTVGVDGKSEHFENEMREPLRMNEISRETYVSLNKHENSIEPLKILNKAETIIGTCEMKNDELPNDTCCDTREKADKAVKLNGIKEIPSSELNFPLELTSNSVSNGRNGKSLDHGIEDSPVYFSSENLNGKNICEKAVSGNNFTVESSEADNQGNCKIEDSTSCQDNQELDEYIDSDNLLPGQTTQEFGDFAQAFDNVLESHKVICDKNDICDKDNSADVNRTVSERDKSHSAASVGEICCSAEVNMLSKESDLQVHSGNPINGNNIISETVLCITGGELSETKEEAHNFGSNWICTSDPVSGKKVYVHQVTGHSSYREPTDGEPPPYSMVVNRQKGQLLTSAGASFRGPESVRSQPVVSTASLTGANSCEVQYSDTGEIGAEKDSVKWREAEKKPTSVSRLLENWQNPMYKVPSTSVLNAELGNEQRSIQRIRAATQPVNFTKEMLHNVKVLNQIDNKFIACLVKSSVSLDTEDEERKELLVVIDQHAAHERVRLETFTKDVYENIESKQLKTQTVEPPLEVSTTDGTVRTMEAYRSYFSRIGVGFKVLERTLVSVDSVPACFVQDREGRDRREESRMGGPTRKQPQDNAFLLRQIQLLIREQVDVLEKTHGANITLPKIIHQVLCARACHGAIKFGDPLTRKECEDLIGSLRECQLPFQCAHGRPAVMPLLDTSKLRTQSQDASKPQLRKLRESRETKE